MKISSIFVPNYICIFVLV